jgi:hypothetical protein
VVYVEEVRAMPDTITIDATGISNQIIPFVVVLNSHDGSCLFHVVMTPWRPACRSIVRFAVRDAHSGWCVRHTP